MTKSKEEQIKTLLARHSSPPLEVVIPILKKAGRGEEELESLLYKDNMSLANGLKETLGLKDKNMKTIAKMFEVIIGSSYGQKFEPIELSETRFFFTVSDCPMLHLGKDVGTSVKSKFCDLICSVGAKAIATAVLGPESTCTWDKALIKGAGKCKVVFESGKKK